MGQPPPPHCFRHCLGTELSLASRLHRVIAEVIVSSYMSGLLACTGGRVLECLTWCCNFRALYFRNKAEKQESGRNFHPLQAKTLPLAPANCTRSGDSGKKKALHLVKLSQSCARSKTSGMLGVHGRLGRHPSTALPGNCQPPQSTPDLYIMFRVLTACSVAIWSMWGAVLSVWAQVEVAPAQKCSIL